MKKIAIFGGTFNPPHIGHQQIIKYLINKIQLEKLYIIPSMPWQKTNILNSMHRINMCRLCFNNISSNIYIDDFEINKPAPSYTIDTLKYFKNLYPNNELIFIIGFDQLANLNSWKEWQKLFNYANFYIIKRADIDTNINKEIMAFIQQDNFLGKKLIVDDWQPFNISSTIIRSLIASKKYNLLNNYLDKNVLKYIIDNSLYLN